MVALRELFAKFDVSVNLNPLRAASGAVDGLRDGLGALGKSMGVVAGALGLGSFAKSLVSTGNEIGTLSQRIGMSAHDMQMWSYATSLDLNEFSIAAKFLENSLQGAADGSKAAVTAFSRLGVRSKNADGSVRQFGDVLPDLAEAFAKIQDPTKQTALALDLFGRSGIQMLPALKKGREGVEELRRAFDKNGGGFSDKAVASAKKASKALKDIKLQFQSLKGQIAENLLPGLATAWGGLGRFTSGLLEATAATHVFQVAAVAAGAMAVKAFLPLLATWGGPLLLVGGLALAVDDLWTAIEGGRSLSGGFLDWLTSIPNFAQQATQALGILFTRVNRFFHDYAEMAGAVMSLDFRRAGQLYAQREDRQAARDRGDLAQANFRMAVKAGEAQGPTREELGAPSLGDERFAEREREQRARTEAPPTASANAQEALAQRATLGSVFTMSPGAGVRTGATSTGTRLAPGALGVTPGMYDEPAAPKRERTESLEERMIPVAPSTEDVLRKMLAVPQTAPAPAGGGQVVNVTVSPQVQTTVNTSNPREAIREARDAAREVVEDQLRAAMSAVPR